MNKFIFNFEGELLELPACLSDLISFTQQDVKFEHDGQLFVIDEKIVKGLKDECKSLKEWDKESERQELLSITFNMKKVD